MAAARRITSNPCGDRLNQLGDPSRTAVRNTKLEEEQQNCVEARRRHSSAETVHNCCTLRVGWQGLLSRSARQG